MKWIAFAALDIYVGLIILEAFVASLPAEKLARAKRAGAVILASLGWAGNCVRGIADQTPGLTELVVNESLS